MKMMKKTLSSAVTHRPAEPKIINADPRYGKAQLIEPTTRGYLHIAAEVSPLPLPFIPGRRKKAQLLAELKESASELERLDMVETVTVFDAIAIPPVNRLPYIKERADTIHVARFDVVVLIETTSPGDIRKVQDTPAYQALLGALRSKAGRLHVLAARNAKRIGDVDETRPGVFLFNYFVADDAEVMLRLWDYLAGWYTVETGLDNSILLVPLKGEHSDYLAVNHARWDESLPRVISRQLSKKSFRTYVLANLEANRVGSMPILYRLAADQRRTVTAAPSWWLALGAAAIGGSLVWRRRRSAARQAST